MAWCVPSLHLGNSSIIPPTANEEHWRREEENRRREAAEHEARERANEERRRAEEEARRWEEQRAREAQENAAREEEARRREEQRAREARENAERAEEARRREEQRAREAQESAERYRQECERERLRAEESARRERAAREEAERVRAQAEEAAARAKAQQEAAKEAERIAREEAERARQAAEEASRQLALGIQPVVRPTEDELNKTKKDREYVEGAYHFAVAGISGSGKSSLINALRGITNGTPSAARTGITETTGEITRYPDPNPSSPFVWYDVPGAGTLSIPGWQYFHQQGLYIFNCIIVLFDTRFTATDIAILQNCARFKIPAYIVRSKSDQNMVNVLKDVRRTYRQDKLGDAELRKRAKELYIKETQLSVEKGLKEAQPELPSQRVYMISQDILCHLRVTNDLGNEEIDEDELPDGMVEEDEFQANVVDERELLQDILMDAKGRASGPVAM
ncbi:hypothetical protein HWV62_45599 [Athelia sp. TMB]|nr:hypothetical protein HWV62_45599 [Athelia sp. TMB]